MIDFEYRKYQSVVAFTVVNHDYVPANGEQIFLSEVGGSAGTDNYGLVIINWDANAASPEGVFSTYGESTQGTVKSFVGDGIKILRIRLDNQTGTSKQMGGYVLGQRSV